MPTKRSIKWAAPAAVVVAIGGGIGVNSALTADASPSLPQRSAAQLLVDMQQATVPGMSGTVVQKADLGIPALPNTAGGTGSSSLSSLVSGSHTMRMWTDGQGKFRVALLGTLGESDVIRNGRDLWVWSSTQNSSSHITLPQRAAKSDELPAPAPALTPQQAAEKVLKQVDPSTVVTVAGTSSVAGRSAYTLRIEPRNKGSLIDSISLQIDSKEHVPLAFRIDAKGQGKPAIDIAFSHVSFAQPDAKQFTFNPPPGSKQSSPGLPSMFGGAQATRGAKPHTRVVGTDWTQVLVVDGVYPDLRHHSGRSGNELATMFHKLPRVSGTWGSGRVLSSALVSALLTDDGRLVVGMVPPETLYQVAAK